jgi:hypothetical protein
VDGREEVGGGGDLVLVLEALARVRRALELLRDVEEPLLDADQVAREDPELPPDRQLAARRGWLGARGRGLGAARERGIAGACHGTQR